MSIIFFFQLYKFVLNALSRRFEFQADEFANRTLGRGEMLISGITKVEKGNHEFLLKDPLYSACQLSHPPLLERLEAIRAEM
jgi:STE24 endopeptidase